EKTSAASSRGKALNIRTLSVLSTSRNKSTISGGGHELSISFKSVQLRVCISSCISGLSNSLSIVLPFAFLEKTKIISFGIILNKKNQLWKVLFLAFCHCLYDFVTYS